MDLRISESEYSLLYAVYIAAREYMNADTLAEYHKKTLGKMLAEYAEFQKENNRALDEAIRLSAES